MLFDSAKASKRILIIDDNANIHEDFRTILAKHGDGNSDRANLDALEDDLFGTATHSTTSDPTTRSVVDYELEFADQGKEGLAMLEDALEQGRPYFLAFVDMRMPPGWDGLETIEKLWAADPEIQVVICTAFSDYSQLEITERLGRNDNLLILKKPFDQEEVSQLACTLYQKREMTRIALLAMNQMEQLVAERTEEMARAQMNTGVSRKKLGAMIRQMEDDQLRLIQSEKLASIGQLAAGVAHEINNPVGFVTSNLGTMQEYLEVIADVFGLYDQLAAAVASGAETKDLLNKIKAITDEDDLSEIFVDVSDILDESKEGCIRIREIVDNLKTYARSDAANPVMADLKQGIESTLKMIWNELKYKCTVVKNFEDVPLYGCYPGQINQVVTNLLINASHAINDEGTITLNLHQEDQNIILEISDDGCGIRESDMSNIFNPFFTTKPVGKGTGLGLSVSLGIIEKHEGSLTVHSERGVGTTFRISLPLPGLDTTKEKPVSVQADNPLMDEIVIG